MFTIKEYYVKNKIFQFWIEEGICKFLPPSRPHYVEVLDLLNTNSSLTWHSITSVRMSALALLKRTSLRINHC